MTQAEDGVARQMPLIQAALDKALTEAAGERMGFVLLVVPLDRVGDHIAVSNIRERATIIRFIRDVARTLKSDWARAEALAQDMAQRVVN